MRKAILAVLVATFSITKIVETKDGVRVETYLIEKDGRKLSLTSEEVGLLRQEICPACQPCVERSPFGAGFYPA